jgi:hypothetical protein
MLSGSLSIDQYNTLMTPVKPLPIFERLKIVISEQDPPE